MKKHTILLAAALMTAAASQAQSVKIMNGESVVAEYPLTESMSVVFEPAETSGESLAGNYELYREVTLPAMPAMGVLVSDKQTVTLAEEAGGTLSVTLPSCQYSMNGTDFDLPSVTITGVTVTKTDNGYSLDGAFDGEVNGKSANVSFTGTVISGTALEMELVEDMKYGSMPMVLHMVYSSQAPDAE